MASNAASKSRVRAFRERYEAGRAHGSEQPDPSTRTDTSRVAAPPRKGRGRGQLPLAYLTMVWTTISAKATPGGPTDVVALSLGSWSGAPMWPDPERRRRLLSAQTNTPPPVRSDCSCGAKGAASGGCETGSETAAVGHRQSRKRCRHPKLAQNTEAGLSGHVATHQFVAKSGHRLLAGVELTNGTPVSSTATMHSPAAGIEAARRSRRDGAAREPVLTRPTGRAGLDGGLAARAR